MVVKNVDNKIANETEEIDFDDFVADVGFITIKTDEKIKLRFDKIPKLRVSTNRFKNRQFEFPVWRILLLR